MISAWTSSPKAPRPIRRGRTVAARLRIRARPRLRPADDRRGGAQADGRRGGLKRSTRRFPIPSPLVGEGKGGGVRPQKRGGFHPLPNPPPSRGRELRAALPDREPPHVALGRVATSAATASAVAADMSSRDGHGRCCRRRADCGRDHARHHVWHHRAQAGPGNGLPVLMPGKCIRHHAISGSMRSARMSLLTPLNSAVPATRKRVGPKWLLTIFALSSSRLVHGAAFWSAASGARR